MFVAGLSLPCQARRATCHRAPSFRRAQSLDVEAGRVGTGGAIKTPLDGDRRSLEVADAASTDSDIMQLSLFVTALASLAASVFAADPLTIDTPCVF